MDAQTSISSFSPLDTIEFSPIQIDDSLRPSPSHETAKSRIKQAAELALKMSPILRLLQDPRILSLNEDDFLKWLKIVAPLLEKRLKDQETAPLVEAQFIRLIGKRSKTLKDSVPVFRSFGLIQNGGIEIHPKYDWMNFDGMFLTLMDTQRTQLSQNAPLIARESLLNALYTKQKSHSRATKENLDAAFNYISKQNHLGWEHTADLCFARAEAVTEHLLALGFQKEHLFKVVLIGPNLGVFSNEYPWRYHIAAGVELEDSSQHIIDPSLDVERPLTSERWEHLCTRDLKKPLTYPPLIIDRRKQAITFEELDTLEAEDRHTMILIPFNSTCENRDSDYPLSIFPVSTDYPISSYLQITDIFEKIVLEKVNALMLEEAFKGSPLLLNPIGYLFALSA